MFFYAHDPVSDIINNNNINLVLRKVQIPWHSAAAAQKYNNLYLNKHSPIYIWS